MDTSTYSGLREYYYLASLVLWNTHHRFERHLEDEAFEIRNRFQGDEDAAASTVSLSLHEVEVLCASILRYAMLPRFLGLLERMMKGICKVTDQEAYESMDNRSWLKNCRQFLEQRDVDFGKVEDKLAQVRHLVVLRDCVVHANGELAACKKPGPNRIEDAIKAIDSAAKMKDGFLGLGDQVIPTAQICMRGILGHLFKHFDCPLSLTRFQ